MLGKPVCAISVATVLTLGAAACTDSGKSVRVLQNQAPEPGCVVPTDQGAFIPRGRIDTNADSGYLFTPLVQSTVTESENGSTDRVMFIEGADVELSFAPGFFSDAEIGGLESSGLVNFSQAFSGSIFPDGFTSFAFIVVPKPLLDAIGDKLSDGGATVVTASVTVFGELDGGDIESNPFNYPIEVCEGCMLIDNGPCTELPDDFEPLTGGNCQVLQDFPIDCCTSIDGDAVCPAVAEDPA